MRPADQSASFARAVLRFFGMVGLVGWSMAALLALSFACSPLLVRDLVF